MASDRARFKLLKGYRLPQFNARADEDIEVFFTHFNLCADSGELTESEKLCNLRLAMHGIMQRLSSILIQIVPLMSLLDIWVNNLAKPINKLRVKRNFYKIDGSLERPSNRYSWLLYV